MSRGARLLVMGFAATAALACRGFIPPAATTPPAMKPGPVLGTDATADGGPVESGSIVGSPNKDLIRKFIHANRAQIRACFESELTRVPTLEGRVLVKFLISASGAVTASEVAGSTAGNPALESCVAACVKSWTFPAPVGGSVAVTYPFIFKQSGR